MSNMKLEQFPHVRMEYATVQIDCQRVEPEEHPGYLLGADLPG